MLYIFRRGKSLWQRLTQKVTHGKGTKKQQILRLFSTGPDQTRLWWDKFLQDMVIPGDWRENLRMP